MIILLNHLIGRVKRWIRSHPPGSANRDSARIRLLDYYEAFDRVMTNDPITDPWISHYRINYQYLSRIPNAVASVDHIRQIYFAKEKYRITPAIVRAYYYYNILNGYVPLSDVGIILEIGAGNGNLSALLHHALKDNTIIIIDLPELLLVSIAFICDIFPNARIIMPHEITAPTIDLPENTFIFLTPQQVGKIPPDSVDLTINTASFQEMKMEQIRSYFDLIQSCGKNRSYFFCSNRVEKIPSYEENTGNTTSEPPIRFSEYPWNPGNEVLVYEICRLGRLVQLDDSFNRIEQIRKTNG